MELEVFKERFANLKSKGFVLSHRSGPTGIGHTLEQELGLTENNIAGPDLAGIELKSHRDNSNSLITLFTFNRLAWQMPQLEAIRKYGTLDENGRLGLYKTMSVNTQSEGLRLYVDADTISVRDGSGQVIAVWQLEHLAERFLKKVPVLMLVSAKSGTFKKRFSLKNSTHANRNLQ